MFAGLQNQSPELTQYAYTLGIITETGMVEFAPSKTLFPEKAIMKFKLQNISYFRLIRNNYTRNNFTDHQYETDLHVLVGVGGWGGVISYVLICFCFNSSCV